MRFAGLLMHGYVHHHSDPTALRVAQLTPDQRAALVEAVVRYLRAGFADPGFALFPADQLAAIRRRAGVPTE